MNVRIECCFTLGDFSDSVSRAVNIGEAVTDVADTDGKLAALRRVRRAHVERWLLTSDWHWIEFGYDGRC